MSFFYIKYTIYFRDITIEYFSIIVLKLELIIFLIWFKYFRFGSKCVGLGFKYFRFGSKCAGLDFKNFGFGSVSS